MTPPDEETLARWERLTHAASVGPWEVEPEGFIGGIYVEPTIHANGKTIASVRVGLKRTNANSAFIAAAREAMPLLLAEVRRLRAALYQGGEKG